MYLASYSIVIYSLKIGIADISKVDVISYLLRLAGYHPYNHISTAGTVPSYLAI